MHKQIVHLTPEFRAQTTKAIFAIVLFALVYFIILILAIGLTALCVYTGIMMVAAVRNLVVLGLGIGLAGLGFLILIFVVKFVFTRHRVDRSHLYEITRQDEPVLFELIEEIVSKVRTTFPKKVYLSTDVNAAVFYDSSFWSMFFPIRKNLQIGLGLVNSVTHDELKAILAHEFGHFSQRTMKVGSYVYNVNQVIFNMLNEDESFQKLAGRWANASSYFAIFVIVGFKIIEAIQWVLRKMYALVNKSYMSLSREMEFHADETAAMVTGYQPLKSALLRTDLANHALEETITFYNARISDKIVSANIFAHQRYVLNFLAQSDGIPLLHDLPAVSSLSDNFNKSKLVIKDQWASHPETDERIARLEQTGHISENPNNSPANHIFTDIDALHQKLTKQMFDQVGYEGDVTVASDIFFRETITEEYRKASFSPLYNNYYKNKSPLHFDVALTADYSGHQLADLFSDEMTDLVFTHLSLNRDIEVLQFIANGTYDITTFDYDGQKYKRKDAAVLLEKLRLEETDLKSRILENDRNIYKHFLAAEEQRGSQKLRQLYAEFFEYDQAWDGKLATINSIYEALQFTQVTTEFDQIINNFKKLEIIEAEVKVLIRELINNPIAEPELKSDMKDNFEAYLSKQQLYFDETKYIDESLAILYTALRDYSYLLGYVHFELKRGLLEYQASLHIEKTDLPQKV